MPLRSVSTQLAYRKVVIFPQLSPISFNRVRIGIGRKIGKTEVERDENRLTRASTRQQRAETKSLVGSTRECHAPKIFYSCGSSVRFGWTAGCGGSFRRAGTGSAEGRGSGCVAGDACRWKAGAASSQVAFDASPVVVGARSPLAG